MSNVPGRIQTHSSVGQVIQSHYKFPPLTLFYLVIGQKYGNKNSDMLSQKRIFFKLIHKPDAGFKDRIN